MIPHDVCTALAAAGATTADLLADAWKIAQNDPDTRNARSRILAAPEYAADVVSTARAQARRAAEREQREAERATRRTAAMNCDRCDTNGLLAGGRSCDHRTRAEVAAADAAAKQTIAELRNLLAGRVAS